MSVSRQSDENPLIEEAAKKAAIAWLEPGGAVWCLWSEGALYVVSGPEEQAAPGLAGSTTVTVTLRGDHGGRIVSWPADVTRVAPDSEEWDAITPTLAAKRLNLPADEDTPARWAQSCVVSKLSPSGRVLSLPDDSLAAPPPAAMANRRTKMPFTLSPLQRWRRRREAAEENQPE